MSNTNAAQRDFRQEYGDLHEAYCELRYHFYCLQEELGEARCKLLLLEAQAKDVVLDGETVTLHWKAFKNMQDELQGYQKLLWKAFKNMQDELQGHQKLLPCLSKNLRTTEHELKATRNELATLQKQLDEYMKMDNHLSA